MAVSASWQRCVLGEIRLVLVSVAPNERYWQSLAELGASARTHLGASFHCIAVSISDELAEQPQDATRVRVQLPGRASWRPSAEWCATRRLSGWRHTSILKTALLQLVLADSFDALLVDADWRFTRNPLPALLGCPRMQLIGMRDDRFVNLGLLVVRSTAALRLLAARNTNRSLVAWDQAVVNEELASLGDDVLSCCVANTRWPSCSCQAKSLKSLSH